MPSLPTARDVHIDRLLSDFAIAYGQDLAKDFVADQASTVKTVDKQSDKYAIWNKGDFFRAAMQHRADGDKSARSGVRLSSTTYFCDTFALSTSITDRQRKNADGEIDLEKAKVRWLMQQAKMKRDLVYAANVFATGKWTSNTEQTGVASSPSSNEFLQWNDSSSTPIKDIKEQALVVHTSTGKLPNVGVCSVEVFHRLSEHSTITDLYKHTTPGPVSEELVAKAIGLDRLVLGKSVQNTAAEGATASMAQIFGNHFLLLYVNDSPNDDDATAVATFGWQEFDGITADGAAIKTWREEETASDIYEAQASFDVQITANDLGVMMLNAIA